MLRLTFFSITTLLLSCTLQISADDNFCRKCQVMREYHKNNPSKYTYYEDYLKDLEEKGEEAVNENPENLPEAVKKIMYPKGKNQHAND